MARKPAIPGRRVRRCDRRAGVGRLLQTLGYARGIPVALPLSGVLLFAAVKSGSAFWAVGWLSATFATLELTEGAFMAATMAVARTQTMAAVGVVNTASNLGGIIATPAIAALSADGGWTAVFAAGSVAAAVSGALWLGIDAGRPLAASRATTRLRERRAEQPL